MNFLLSSMPGMAGSKVRRPERVASRDAAFPIAGVEPALALLRAAVSKAVRHHASGCLALQGVVADRGGRLQRRFDIACFDERRLTLSPEAVVLVFRPYPREAIGLQFDLHLKVIRLRAAHALLPPLHLRKDPQKVLHVMTDLVGDHIGLRKLAGLALAAAEAALDLAEERGVQIDLLVLRTVERPHGALRDAAARRLGLALVEDKHRLAIGLAVALEDVGPLCVDVAEDRGDESADIVARLAGAPRLPARHRLLDVRAAGQNFGAADQNARIDAERPADQAQHHDGADPETAATDREAETATAEAAARFTAAILDIVALLGFVQTHCCAPSPGFRCALTRVEARAKFAGCPIQYPS